MNLHSKSFGLSEQIQCQPFCIASYTPVTLPQPMLDTINRIMLQHKLDLLQHMHNIKGLFVRA